MISNIDSIFFSIDIQDYEKSNQDLLIKLQDAKDQAKDNKLTELQISLGSKTFTILPNGARFHSYIIHNESLEIKFAKARSNSKSNYPISIRIKSLMLWEYGFIDAYVKTIEYINSIVKGNIIAEKLSRADMACHVDNFKIDSILDLNESWRGNFRKVNHYFYNRKINGLTFGSFADKNIMARIYDKSLEIKSNKLWFNDIWLKEGMDIENVWNIEFQLGRTYFKEYQIESVADFIKSMRAIWEYLTTKWLSYVDLIYTRVERCPLKPIWEQISKAYLNYCNIVPIKREKQLNKRAEALIPQLVGVLTSYGACKYNLNLDNILTDFKKDIKEYLLEKKDNIQIEQIVYDKIEYLFS